MKSLIKTLSLIMFACLSNSLLADPISTLFKKYPNIHNEQAIIFDKVVLSLVKRDIDFSKESSDTILSFLGKKELRILRNSIFAKYGKTFKSNDLNEYFKKTKWYKISDKTIEINEKEKSIVKKILNYENSTHISTRDITDLFPKIKLPLTIDYDADNSSHKKYYFNSKNIYSRAALRKVFNTDTNVFYLNVKPQVKFSTSIGNAYIIKNEQRSVDSAFYYIYSLNNDGSIIKSMNLCSPGGPLGERRSCIIHIDETLSIYVIVKEEVDDGSILEEITFTSYKIKEDGTISKTNHQ